MIEPLVRAPAAAVDLLVRGAHVLDPRTGIDSVLDVLVREGEIAEIGSTLDLPAGAELIWIEPRRRGSTGVPASRNSKFPRPPAASPRRVSPVQSTCNLQNSEGKLANAPLIEGKSFRTSSCRTVCPSANRMLPPT